MSIQILLVILSTVTSLLFAQDPEPPRPLPPHIEVEVFASGLNVPIAITWAEDGRLFHTEKNEGTIHVRDQQGQLLESIKVPIADADFGDLYGLALDPDFPEEPLLYVFYTHAQPLSNRVLRFRWEGGVVSEPTTLFSEPITTGSIAHNGGDLHFGADGMLYVSLGETELSEIAQDLTNPLGKIIRIDPADGSAPFDNPFHDGDGPNDDRIWALGLRNPFGFTFDPITGNLWATDNGPGCGDEVNHVTKGGNYGWPLSSISYFKCVELPPPYISPEWSWTPTIAPTGISVYDGLSLSDWYGDLMMCAWKTGNLYRFDLDETRTHIIALEEIDISPAVCRIAVASGPDGYLYMSTRDGAIYRLKSTVHWLPVIWHQ